MVTWGDIAGTPLILDPTQGAIDVAPHAGGSKFTVKALPDRDALGHALDARNKVPRLRAQPHAHAFAAAILLELHSFCCCTSLSPVA